MKLSHKLTEYKHFQEVFRQILLNINTMLIGSKDFYSRKHEQNKVQRRFDI